MGRKDASGQHSQPLEQYRKQIGKQDWKKSKREIRNLKLRADESNEFTPQYIVMMIGTVILLLSTVYLFLVWCVGSGASIQDIHGSRAV